VEVSSPQDLEKHENLGAVGGESSSGGEALSSIIIIPCTNRTPQLVTIASLPSHLAQVRPFPTAPLHLADNGGLQQLLKVGYVSATGFQGNTTTARFMQRIFSLHDASRVEVICIARAGDDGTSERAFIKESCKEWLQFEKNDLYVQPRQKPPQCIITAVADTVRLPPSTPSACMFSST
jgi:hypothetical protein